MKIKILVVVVFVVASGYILKLCFDGMNRPSDLTYIGGILGVCFWFLVGGGLVLKFVQRRVKSEGTETIDLSESNESTEKGDKHE